MKFIISTLASLVVLGWGVAYFRLGAGEMYHTTLLIAVAALVQQWYPKKAAPKRRHNSYQEA